MTVTIGQTVLFHLKCRVPVDDVPWRTGWRPETTRGIWLPATVWHVHPNGSTVNLMLMVPFWWGRGHEPALRGINDVQQGWDLGCWQHVGTIPTNVFPGEERMRAVPDPDTASLNANSDDAHARMRAFFQHPPSHG